MVIQFLKKGLAGTLGKHKDKIKNLPIVKQLNDKANRQLNTMKNDLLKENFYNVLRDVYEESQGILIWLDFGTLLGVVRNNGVIEHDFDMDFAILDEDLIGLEILFSNLEKKGYKKTREFYYDGKLVEYSYSYKGLNIDFVIYRKNDLGIECETIAYMQDFTGKITNVESYRYDLPFDGVVEFMIDDNKVYIPKNSHYYLSVMYGDDYMTPIEHYKWRDNIIYKLVDDKKAKIILSNL